MPKDIKIVFMGTPEFAVTILKSLIDNMHNVVGVITAPDRPAGRGQKMKESAVKKYALKQGLPILQPPNLKNETFLKALRSLNANLQVVVAFRMLPKVVWELPIYGTFNLHASLLPNYRGAAPINWAIINGENKTGVTTFFIDDKIDTGELILQKETIIEQNETAGQLHDRLMNLGSTAVLETIDLINKGPIKTIVQRDSDNLKSANKLTKENCRIDWQDSLHNIYNKIRGLSPYPAAWSLTQNGDDELAIKIYSCSLTTERHNHPTGQLITTKTTAKVAVANGYIDLLEVQLPGKRKMDIKSLLNGFEFSLDAKML